ncbi:MAG: hypothetical protein QOF01_3735 [Thermomicrobiales bacterium]|nr:hypothetical protein [Thermomicrobiales bacterium]
MMRLVVLAHPSDLPHADALGVGSWLQWLVVAVALGIGGWLVLDARAERRSGRGETPETSDAVAAPPPVNVTSLGTSSTLNPPGLLVLVAGFAAGWVALDRVRAVDALASFIRTDGAAQVARLGFCFAALLWVGAALAPVAPKGAALAFGVAGVIGVFLATAASWERHLEWWGAATVLDAWERLPLWVGGAFVLALLAVGAGRFQPGRAVRSSGPGTIPAAGSSRPPERIV